MFFCPAVSAPEGGEHGDYLLFAAHHAFEEEVVVLGLLAEGLAYRLVVAHIKDVRALLQHVGNHEYHHVEVLLVPQLLHQTEEFVPAAEQMVRVDAGDLADAYVLLGYVELLVVGVEELLGALAVRAAGGIELLAYLVERDAGYTREALRHGYVPLGAGGGLEHDRVGEYGPGHQPGYPGRGDHAALLVHAGEDGVGAAHGLIAHPDGLCGLDIRQTVVVYYLQNLHLVQAGDGLGGLVVVHQHHLLAAGAQKVEAGDGAHDLVVFVQDGVAAVAALEHYLAHVVQIVAQVKGHDVLGHYYPLHGQGLVDYAGDTAGGEGSGDDAGVAAGLGPLGPQRGAADDEAAHAALQGAVDYLGLLAADEHGVRIGEGGVLVVLRQGDVELSGDGADRAVELIDQRALQHAEQVEERDVVHAVFRHGLHVIGGDVARREHAEESAVVLHDGHHAHLAVAHGAPGQVQGHRAVEGGRAVVVQVADLGAQGLDEGRRRHTEAGEETRGLVVYAAYAHGFVCPVAQRGILQIRVGYGRDYGVGVRVAVSGYIDVAHGVKHLPSDWGGPHAAAFSL